MIFDLVVLAAILISCLIAFLRGFIREVLTILGVIGGAFAAVSLGPKLAPLVRGWLGHKKEEAATGNVATSLAHADADKHADRLFGILPYDMAADLIAYGGIFIVVVIVLSIVSHLLSGFAKKIGLGMVDRTLGILFGAARAIVLLALPYYAISTIADKQTMDKWFEGSHTRVYIEATADWLGSMVPKSVSKDIDKATDKAADKASHSFADTTRERLEKLNLLKDDTKDNAKGEDTKALVKEKAEDAGAVLKAKTDDIKDRLRDAGDALRGKPAYTSSTKPVYTSTGAGYGTQQREQMDGLIRDESQSGAQGHQ